MKKYGIFFLLVISASAFLAGCSAKDESTQEPLKPPANDSRLPKSQQEPIKPSTD